MVSAKGGRLEDTVLQPIIDVLGIRQYFSPTERVFIDNRNPTDNDRQQFGWREAARVLFWSLGFVRSLGLPKKQTAPGKSLGIMDKNRGLRGLVLNAKPRDATEVLNEADLLYRCHRAVSDAQLKCEVLRALDFGVTIERHYAINWLTLSEEWDEVDTDT